MAFSRGKSRASAPSARAAETVDVGNSCERVAETGGFCGDDDVGEINAKLREKYDVAACVEKIGAG